MRISDWSSDVCSSDLDGQGVEIFVYGVRGGRFPARQHLDASKAIARKHRLDPARTLFIRQSDSAIQGGAFHNDVVAVANEHVLFTHETAFEDREEIGRASCRERVCQYV